MGIKTVFIFLLASVVITSCNSSGNKDPNTTSNDGFSSTLLLNPPIDTNIIQITDSNGVCNYVEETEKNGNVYLLSKATEINEMVDMIVQFMGLPKNFEVRAATVTNAVAIIPQSGNLKEQRVILYNPDFFMRVDSATFNKWGVISVLCHEISHHVLGHTSSKEKQLKNELDADKQSGWFLYKLGANKEASIAAIMAMGSESTSATHPNKNNRRAAILAGWAEAEYGTYRINRMLKDFGAETEPKSPPPSSGKPRPKGPRPATTTQNDTLLDFKSVAEKPKAHRGFYLVIVKNVATRTEAIQAVKALKDKGYAASRLWGANYPSLSINGHAVYLGPFYSQQQCEVAVEHYKAIDPNVYGQFATDLDIKIRVDGFGEVSKK